MATNDSFGPGILGFLQRFNQMKQELPDKVANLALNHFKASFARQGFDDEGVVAWDNVQRRMSGYKAYLYPKKKGLSRRTRPILFGAKTKRGPGRDLFNSLHKQSVRWDNVIIASNLKYSARHNEGLAGMPKRKFIGNSRNLNSKIKRHIELSLKDVMKGE